MMQIVKLFGLMKLKYIIKREISNIKQNRKSSSITLIIIISAVLPQYNANNNKNDALLLPGPPAFNSCTFCNKLEYCTKKLTLSLNKSYFYASTVGEYSVGDILQSTFCNCTVVVPKQFFVFPSNL